MDSEAFHFHGYEYLFKNSDSKLQKDATKISDLGRDFVWDVILESDVSEVRASFQKCVAEAIRVKGNLSFPTCKKAMHEEEIGLSAISDLEFFSEFADRLEFSSDFIDTLINYDYSNLRIAVTNFSGALSRTDDLLSEEDEAQTKKSFLEGQSKLKMAVSCLLVAGEMFNAILPHPDSKLKLVKEFFQYILQHVNTKDEFVEFKKAIQRDFSDYMLPLVVLNEYKAAFSVEEFNQLESVLLKVGVEIATEKMLELDLPDSALSKHSQEKVLEQNLPDSVLGEHLKEGEQKSELELT